MRKQLAASALALAMAIGPAALAAHNQPHGFDTTSCKYPADKPLPGSGAVREVSPTGYATIQAAVNAAQEGDTILIHPGTYNERVDVKRDKAGLRIRGVDRNTVILDGQNSKEIGFEITADRVMVENLTVHNYIDHGIRWKDQTGYWGRYITAYNNGLYGIFAFGSRCGQIDHSFASGNADSGFYIGQCFPCDAVIHDIEARGNALGYSGTNAGGNLVLRDSVWNDNGLGIVPNSLDSEARPPQRGLTIKNNIVSNNNGRTTPGSGIAAKFYGGGIIVAGGANNVIAGNVVENNSLAGIAIVPLPSDPNVWIPAGNTVWGNKVSHDAALYPDSYDLAQGSSSGANNCWADNEAATTAPAMLQNIWSCALTTTPPGGDPRVEVVLASGFAGLNDRDPAPWETWPAPGAQTTQPAGLAGALSCWLPALGLC